MIGRSLHVLMSGFIIRSTEVTHCSSVVVVNLCFTSLFGTKGLLSDIVIR